jgi:hypothetical protein
LTPSEDDVVTERFIIDGTITGVWSPQVEGVLALPRAA